MAEAATNHPALHETDLQLIDGYRIKPIDKRYLVLDADGASLHDFCSPQLAISKLVIRRQSWAKGAAAMAKQKDLVIRELLEPK